MVQYVTAFISGLMAFLVTYYITPWAIRYLRRIDLVVKDQHKEGKPLVPISGGLAVLAGLMAGFMVFIFVRAFILKDGYITVNADSLSMIFAVVISIVTITLVGFIDDLMIKKSKDYSIGLKQWQKPLLTLAAAVPLIVIQAGHDSMIVPFIGRVNFGILYPLLLVPLAVVGASNMVNMLAGLNGMETGMAMIYLGSLGLYAFVHDRSIGALIALVAFFSLLAFYLYTKYPSKILPGDSLTYLIGSVFASLAIVGDLERASLISSIPFIAEFFLKARGKFKKQTYGYYEKGRIRSQYKEIYSIPHIFMRTGKFTEKQVVYFMYIIQAVFSLAIWII